jgi:hypothetical protein
MISIWTNELGNFQCWAVLSFLWESPISIFSNTWENWPSSFFLKLVLWELIRGFFFFNCYQINFQIGWFSQMWYQSVFISSFHNLFTQLIFTKQHQQRNRPTQGTWRCNINNVINETKPTTQQNRTNKTIRQNQQWDNKIITKQGSNKTTPIR